jgi:hypothetical protein
MNSTVHDDDEIISVGKALPRIARAEPLDRRRVRVWWRGGDSPVTVDVEPALLARRIFAPLRADDELFRSFKVSEYGDCLEWADNIELSAVWIERLAEATLENGEFRHAMEEMEMSLDSMAAYLGVSRRLIASYRKDKPIPKAVALATRYLLEQRKAS